MTLLKEQPLLVDYQQFIFDICKERGWDKRTITEKMLFMTEEVGEVAKAIRKELGFDGKKPETIDHLAEELVDVLNYVLDIANNYDIDLESAFRAKWTKNATRTWGYDQPSTDAIAENSPKQ
ncbi:MAG: MazG nucleotide pyrophosphohydrolase domain-containing protein [Candidatus Saccharibacteria bacterium]